MVKTKGVTLVALATLLAGFVAPYSSAEAPSIADLQSSTVTIEIVVEDEPPALTSSPVALDRATPYGTSEHTRADEHGGTQYPTPVATHRSEPTATATIFDLSQRQSPKS